MPHSGINQAVTEHGAQYNKLKRPDDFLTSLTAEPPPRERIVSNPTESTKRTLEEANISEDEAKEEPPKRSRIQRRPVNMDTGMHSMFPGMLDEGALSDDSTTNEALAYLRGVRTEASSIPTLLLAPREPEAEDAPQAMYENGRGDHRVVYKDGTWIARDTTSADNSYEDSSDEPEDSDPQEQYYRKLLSRYETMRTKLNDLSPAAPAPHNSKPDASRPLATEVPRNRHEWLYILDREYPSPALASRMRERDIFNGLKYAAHSLDRFRSITKQKSCWIWSLLAMVPEQGTLDYTKIGVVRDLGHKAGQFGMKLRSGVLEVPQSYQEEEEVVEEWVADGQGVNEEEEGEVVDECEQMIKREENEARRVADEARPGGEAEKGDEGDSTSDMSISDEEGEKQLLSEHAQGHAQHSASQDNLTTSASQKPEPASDEEGELLEDEPSTLEEARARVLAQLGDRLVQPGGSTATPKIDAAPKAPFANRAEAELQRQKLREQQLAAQKGETNHHLSVSQELEMQDVVLASSHEEVTHSKSQVTVSTGIKTKESGSDIGHVEIPDLNSRVTIDMILTVVAECYGQKDLLRFRDIWVG